MAEAAGPVFSLITTSLITTTIVFVVVATMAVALRFYVVMKSKSSTRIEADHWLVLAALVFCYGFMIQTICAGAIGGVNYSSMQPLVAASFFAKIAWTDLFLTQPASTLVKLSILQFYKRIFITSKFRLACNVQMALCIVWCIATIFTQLFCANPISGAWSVTADYLVIDYPTFALAIFGAGIVLDTITLCLPLPVIGTLHMETYRKWKIAAIFWLGIFCVVAAAVRFYYTFAELNAVDSSFDGGFPYGNLVGTATWSRIEPSASIIAACLPLYGSLVPKSRTLESAIRSAIELFSVRSTSRGSRGSSTRNSRRAPAPPTEEDEAALTNGTWHKLSETASVSKGMTETEERVSDSQIKVTSDIDVGYARAT